MKKLFAMVMAVSAGLCLASCEESATDEEIRQMCEHLGRIDGKGATPEATAARTAAVSADYDARMKALEEESAKAMAAIDAEQEAMAAETKTQDYEKRAGFLAETTKKKAAKSGEFGVKMQQLKEEREIAVGKDAEAAEKDTVAWSQAVDACMAESRDDGVSKKVALCRIEVATADEYRDKCK